MLWQPTVLLADIPGLSIVFGFVRRICFGCVFTCFIVVFDSRDSVITVEPFTQVNQLASVAAEGIEFSIQAVLPGRFIDNLVAYRTSAFHIAC
jgi:hypothetical protein